MRAQLRAHLRAGWLLSQGASAIFSAGLHVGHGDDTTLPEGANTGQDRAPPLPRRAALVVLWCADEPTRAGELLLLPANEPRVFGRGAGAGSDPFPRVRLVRQRPNALEATAPLDLPRLSRLQLEFRAEHDGSVAVKNLGRCPLFHNDSQVDHARVRPGDVIRLGQQMSLLCSSRPGWLSCRASSNFDFGAPDGAGLVGESEAAWELRAELERIGRLPGHVLVLGPSGVGKELVVRALHACSARAQGPFVARNAATLPEGLVDAELFGNARNYPHAGLPERAGLVGQAHNGTLFLDEIAELPLSSQAHLLRALDAGEYHRLGEAQARTANFRLIAATNRPDSELKFDFRARFTLHIQVPDLNARREDIPLLCRHLLARIQAAEPERTLMLDQATTLRLTRHEYSTNVRELEALLWNLTSSRPRESTLDEPPTEAVVKPLPEELTAARMQACLDENNGSIEKTWRALGLSSRHALSRLIAKHGLQIRRAAQRPR